MTCPRSAGNNHETACFSYLQDCCDKLTFVLTLDCPGNLVLAPRPVSTRHPLREVPTLSLVSRRPPAVVPLYLANPAIRLVQPPAGECAADFSCLSTSRAAASSRICKAIFCTAILVGRCRSSSLVRAPASILFEDGFSRIINPKEPQSPRCVCCGRVSNPVSRHIEPKYALSPTATDPPSSSQALQSLQ